MSKNSDKQAPDYNLFRIIESADKEMIHSAMVKFFMETFWNDPMLDCFHLKTFKDKNLTIQLEESHTYDPKSINSKNSATVSEKPNNDKSKVKKSKKLEKVRIRFDIVGRIDNDRPAFIIENKFKAVPTKAQLESYDKALSVLWGYEKDDPNKNLVKVLMVFSAQQISKSLWEHLNKNKWVVTSYLSINDKKDKNVTSFFDTLKTLPPFDDPNKLPPNPTDIDPDLNLNYIVTSYRDRLKDYDDIFTTILNSEHYLKYGTEGKLSLGNSEVESKGLATRFIYLQYLISIQQQIDERLQPLKNEGKIKEYTMSNNGGSQVVPSVAFWFNVPNVHSSARFHALYFSIDGMTAKIGFCYTRANGEKIDIEKVREFLVKKLNESEPSGRYFNSNISESKNNKAFKPHKDNVQAGYSVYAPICIAFKGDLEKENVINDAVKIISSLYSEDVLKDFEKIL
jgi:hypothetical protein